MAQNCNCTTPCDNCRPAVEVDDSIGAFLGYN